MVNADEYKITFGILYKDKKNPVSFACALLNRAFNTETRQKNAHDLRIDL